MIQALHRQTVMQGLFVLRRLADERSKCTCTVARYKAISRS